MITHLFFDSTILYFMYNPSAYNREGKYCDFHVKNAHVMYGMIWNMIYVIQ